MSQKSPSSEEPQTSRSVPKPHPAYSTHPRVQRAFRSLVNLKKYEEQQRQLSTVITRVIVYASTCVAPPVLRRRSKVATSVRTVGETSRSFELPGGILVSVVCVILCLCLLANSGWREARDVAIALIIGVVIYAAHAAQSEKTQRMMTGVIDRVDISCAAKVD